MLKHLEQQLAEREAQSLRRQRRIAESACAPHQLVSSNDCAPRELLTFCMLVSMGGAEPQAVGHAKGNAAVGNDKDFLINAVTQLLPFLGYPRTLNALRCINEALPD